jgi:toluene monooxygenase system ferredoxin subunit
MIHPQTLDPLELFTGLTEAQLAVLAGLAEEVTCPAGETLFEEGASASRLYVLLEGKVSIQVQLSSRPERITVASLSQPGQLVGWSGTVHPNNYTASATCQSDSRLLSFDGQAFMQALEADHTMGFLVMRRISEVVSGRLRNIQRVVLKTL